MVSNSRQGRALITIVGLGPGAPDQLSLGAWQALQQAETLFLRTAVHPTVRHIAAQGISFDSFDSLYESAESFDSLYQEIADRMLVAARSGPATYAVPGHPLVGETSVQLILAGARNQGIDVAIVPSMSALDAIFAATRLDPTAGLQICDTLAFDPKRFLTTQPALFLQLYNRFTASELKLSLLELFSPDFPVLLIRAAGVPGEERVLSLPLHELGMEGVIDHLTSLYVPAAPNAHTTGMLTMASASPASTVQHPLDPLVTVMQHLLSEHGCPWDRKQTHQSLKRYLIEETYEVVDAIDIGDSDALCEELGDVLLQIVFHAQLASMSGTFTIDDVVNTITAKMLRRHPHVFGNVRAEDTQTVLRNWEAIKQAEKEARGTRAESLLSGIPQHLPALMRAEEVQKRAAKVGFEWEDVRGALAKVSEEVRELEVAAYSGTPDQRADELGDALFALVNVARYLSVDPEDALRATTGKFIRRFRHIEKSAARAGRSLAEMTLSEMDAYWNEAKELEQRGAED